MKYTIIITILFLAEIIYFFIARKFNIIDKPNLRSSHTNIILRGGGIIFFIGAWVYAIFFGFEYMWFLLGLTLISVVSFIDDIRSISNRIRLVVQFISVMLMFYDFGILNIESWWVIILGLVLCVGIINAFNFMDGINGITGGYSLSVLLPLLFVNESINFIDKSFILVSIISVLVFCFFNFRKNAKCFAGDVGSIGIAFIILFAVGKLILQTGDFTYIVFLTVYGIDTVLTIVHRIILHENLGEAHRKHVYQLMANELHIPHVFVSILYMFLQFVISFGFIYFPFNHWIYLICILILLSIVYLMIKMKYYHLHVAYLKSKDV